jgi:hypothetical protein
MFCEKGYIQEILNGGKVAKIVLSDNSIHEFLMLYPYGDGSNIEVDDNSLALVMGSSIDDAMAIPFNLATAKILEATEKAVGNFKKGNIITFKKNGDIEVSNTENFIVSASNIELGDASANVLNQNASMQVVITSGSSAGTYPVQINSAGQTKVKA